MDLNSNLYAAGGFTDSPLGYQGNSYVAKWNGVSWSKLGTGINALNANNAIFSILSDVYGNIYAAGAFQNANGKEYVAKWDGNTWSEVGSGVNALNADSVIMTTIIDDSGQIFAAGYFLDSSGYNYVAKWDGNTWSEVGTGINALNANAPIYTICMDKNKNLYAAGYFTNANGSEYVAKWDGTSWSELGTGANALNANADILSICLDSNGNLYAAGEFTNLNPFSSIRDSGYTYVAKWNGISWSSLPLNLNNSVSNWQIVTMHIDKDQNIYNAGWLQDTLYNWYVAKYGPLTTGITNLSSSQSISIYPNPTNDFININIDTKLVGTPYSIIDNSGRIVKNGQLQNEKTQVDICELPIGLYVLQIGNEAKQVFKVLKE